MIRQWNGIWPLSVVRWQWWWNTLAPSDWICHICFCCSRPTLNCPQWKGLMMWLADPRWSVCPPPLPSFASTLRPRWQNLQRQNFWSLTWWISSGCRGEKALTQMCLPLSAYMFSQSSRLVSQQETVSLQSDTEMLRYFDGVFQLERKHYSHQKLCAWLKCLWLQCRLNP